jgi:pilus assembly protein CpaB
MLSSKLSSAGDSDSKTLAYAIEPGMRAITIPADETSGIAYMITPGDHVDIIGYFLTEKNAEEGGTEKISYTTLLLENITVLAFDNVYSDAGKANSETPAYTTMTLQVTPQQAMKLSMAQSEGVIRTVLRSPVDEDEVGLPKITLNNILGK